MHISWLGTTGFKIQTRHLEHDVTVLIDPYLPDKGSSPRSLTADLVLLTRGNDNLITLPGTPFILETPGEIDSRGVLVTSVAGHTATSVMFRVDTEGMSIGHLGLINTPLTTAQLDVLSGIDILCIPIGHEHGFDTATAIKVVNSIEPRIVIPMAFLSDNDPTAKSADTFVRELGVSMPDEEKKVVLKKKDLPEEETRVIVFGKE